MLGLPSRFRIYVEGLWRMGKNTNTHRNTRTTGQIKGKHRAQRKGHLQTKGKRTRTQWNGAEQESNSKGKDNIKKVPRICPVKSDEILKWQELYVLQWNDKHLQQCACVILCLRRFRSFPSILSYTIQCVFVFNRVFKCRSRWFWRNLEESFGYAGSSLGCLRVSSEAKQQ